MKLSDIKQLAEAKYAPNSEVFKDVDLWLDGTYGLETTDVEVEFDYEGESYTDHPYGSTTAREYHGAQVDILAVKLIADAKVYDDDGDQVIDTLKKGTDLMTLPWWKESYTEWFENEIHEMAEKNRDNDDYDDYDYDDRY